MNAPQPLLFHDIPLQPMALLLVLLARLKPDDGPLVLSGEEFDHLVASLRERPAMTLDIDRERDTLSLNLLSAAETEHHLEALAHERLLDQTHVSGPPN